MGGHPVGKCISLGAQPTQTRLPSPVPGTCDRPYPNFTPWVSIQLVSVQISKSGYMKNDKLQRFYVASVHDDTTINTELYGTLSTSNWSKQFMSPPRHMLSIVVNIEVQFYMDHYALEKPAETQPQSSPEALIGKFRHILCTAKLETLLIHSCVK